MSSASPKTQEPSMEEILASIRRIIADDQESGKAAEPAAPPPPPPAPPARPAAVRPAAPPPEPEPDDDILDLAGVAEPLPPPAPHRAPPPKLDLDHEDVSFRDLDPNQIDFDALDIGEDDPEPLPPPPEPEPPPRPRAARPPEPPDAEHLMSGVTDAAVGQAFNMLAHTVLTSNARTLEDLVKEMLRPMLKNWLDDNLPTLVERLVRAEIERVSRGGR